MATHYPAVLSSVITECGRFRSRLIGIDELKAVVWNAAIQIVAVEERDLRRGLQMAEGQLDMVQFSYDDEEVFHRALEVVDGIELLVKMWV